MEKVVIQYELDEKTYIEINRECIKYEKKEDRGIVNFFCGANLLLGLIDLLKGNFIEFTPNRIWVHLFCLILIIIANTNFLKDFLARRAFRKSLRKNEQEENKKRIFEFTEETFSVSQGKENSTALYNKIKRVVETKNMFFLYVDAFNSIKVFKRFSTVEEIDNIRKILQSNIKKYKIINK